MAHRKLRIAVVASYFPHAAEPYRGHSTYQTLRAMRQEAEIEGFVPLPSYPRISWLEPARYRYQRPDRPQPLPDLPARYFEYPAMRGLSRPFHGWLATRALQNAVTHFQPDMVLNYWLYPDGYAAWRIARALRKPFVAGAIGSDLRQIGDPWTRWATRAVLRNADAVITVSRELREKALTLGAAPENTYAILNGCDTSTFFPAARAPARAALGLPARAPVILFVGNLVVTKGLRELVAAASELRLRRPDLQLVLVGEGPLHEELARAGRGPLTACLRLAGRASSSEVARWLAACDVFCLPSYSEGCPNVVVEALASGRPVVASDTGGIPELVDSTNGILIPPRDATRLAAALDQALDRPWDPSLIAARSGRSWADSARETLAVCRKVLSR